MLIDNIMTSNPIGMFSPVGWVNPVTPGSATVTLGSSVQTVQYSSSGSDPLFVGFSAPATWSDNNALQPDASGANWVCTVPGVYFLSVSQNLTLFNLADATDPVVDLIVTVNSSTTSEFNTVLVNSITAPITTAPIVVNTSVSGYVNLDSGSGITISVKSSSGNDEITSGYNVFPSPNGMFQFNLVAQGAYGDVGVIV